MGGPLAGLKVVDLSSMMSGPWAADILGDQGADVIKVEVPGKGDHVRSLPNRSGDMSAMFVNVNRSKRSLTLNLKSAEGVELLKRLVATADVLVQNFRPGVVERLGIGYDDLAEVNPRLVYLSMSGFGERGPGARQRVYDPLIQALTGLTTVQAGSDTERPRLIRTILPDKLSAIVAAQALTAGLLARERTGQGQHIRLSMLDSVLSFLWASDMGAYTFADKPVPVEKGGSFIDLIYRTADGYMTVATNSNAEWQSLCQATGQPTDGMAGRGILVLDTADPNVGSMLDTATDRGRRQVVVQRWLPAAAHGDRRVIVLDGRPVGVVRRVAVPGDFRCNMAAGAQPVADAVTERDREICAGLAPLLRQHGLPFVGIDVIGGCLTEVNVTSPTGVREIDALTGSRIAEDVISWAERRCRAMTRTA